MRAHVVSVWSVVQIKVHMVGLDAPQRVTPEAAVQLMSAAPSPLG